MLETNVPYVKTVLSQKKSPNDYQSFRDVAFIHYSFFYIWQLYFKSSSFARCAFDIDFPLIEQNNVLDY